MTSGSAHKLAEPRKKEAQKHFKVEMELKRFGREATTSFLPVKGEAVHAPSPLQQAQKSF